MEEMSRLLTVKETCTYLRISPPTLYRMIERGEMTPVKIGKRTLFDKKDLDGLIDGAKGAPLTKPGATGRRKKEPASRPKAKSKPQVVSGSEGASEPEPTPRPEPKPKAPPKEKPKPKPEPDRLF
jgi:excisionase family DNA binding protein